MKLTLSAALLILLSSTAVHAKQIDRTAQVSKFFLTQANKLGTAINKKLSASRDEAQTGFCHNDCPLAQPLTSKDIQIVKTESRSEEHTSELQSH